MAYVHCHSCDWSQDDFYSPDGYIPAKSLADWNDSLCGDKLDEQFTDDALFVKENGPITTREVIARDYEKFAQRIRDMKWVTEEQYRNDPYKVCPKCGEESLDVD